MASFVSFVPRYDNKKRTTNAGLGFEVELKKLFLRENLFLMVFQGGLIFICILLHRVIEFDLLEGECQLVEEV